MAPDSEIVRQAGRLPKLPAADLEVKQGGLADENAAVIAGWLTLPAPPRPGAANRRTQPRTVPTGRPTAAATVRTPAPVAFAANAVPITATTSARRSNASVR